MSEYVAELKFIHYPGYGKTENTIKVVESVACAICGGISDMLLAPQTGTVCEELNDPLSSTARCCLSVHRLPTFPRNMHNWCDSSLKKTKQKNMDFEEETGL